jgi:YtcA family
MKTDHRRVAIAAFSSVLMGCARAPSIDILGSFFPVWMVCLSAAVVLTFFARSLIVRCRLESHVGPVVLFYPSLVVLFSCLLWLISFR